MRLLRTVPSPRRTRVRRSDRVPFLELVEPRLLLANLNILFTVNSAADDPSGPTPGIVTLRDAINEVNNDKTDVDDNFDAITFAISGTPTISLAADLPAITAPVFIDGESQPGYSGTPLIQIDGQGVLGSGSGLTLSPGSGGSTIVGLNIYGFSQGAGLLIQSSFNTVEKSNLGTDGTSATEKPNAVGVVISGTNPFSGPEFNTFTGCTFSGNSLYGVYMSVASSNSFTGCTFSGNSLVGVSMSVASSNSFTGCTFSGSSLDGVYMSVASSNSFTGCTFSGNLDGVYMSSADSNRFNSCNFSGNSVDGLAISGSFFNTFTGCTFSGNSSIDGYGLAILGSSSNTFTGCTFSGNFDGVDMSSADSNTFNSCNFSGNSSIDGYGLAISGSISNTFTGCTFSGNYDGVDMSSGGKNTFKNCNFSGNSFDGLAISGSISNKFTGCTFSGNYDGVYMSSADTNTFNSCNFSGNSDDGVDMSSADSNIFNSCNFSGNTSSSGVFMSFADGNKFTGCTFSGNAFAGVYMLTAFDNTVTGCTIRGNNNAGIIIGLLSEDNVIDENDIVTPSNGSSTQQYGILINDSIDNTIGGTTAGSTTPANVIGGNNVGILISGFNSSLTGANFIEGNYIGVTTEDGSAIGNLYGIWIDDVPNNLIGGTAEGASNTISDNTWAGVYISGLDATGNLVEGNSILGPNNKGPRTDPTNPLPIGVFIQNASSNTIGGAAREIRSTVTTWVST